MKRTRRMLIVMLTSFSIFAILTFLTFSSYGKNTTQSFKNYTIKSENNINHLIVYPQEITQSYDTIKK